MLFKLENKLLKVHYWLKTIFREKGKGLLKFQISLGFRNSTLDINSWKKWHTSFFIFYILLAKYSELFFPIGHSQASVLDAPHNGARASGLHSSTKPSSVAWKVPSLLSESIREEKNCCAFTGQEPAAQGHRFESQH